MKLVIGQQLHSAGEMLLQHLHREVVAGGLIGGDVVQRLLEGKPVQRLGAIGVETVENIGDSLLSLGCLQIGVVLHLAHHGNGGAGVIGLHNQAKTVGQRRVRGNDVVGRHLKLRERARGPGRQHNRLGRSRGHLLSPAKTLGGDGLSRGRRLQSRSDGVAC